MDKRTEKKARQEIKYLVILILNMLVTACCEHILYTTIENDEQRSYYIACLRANNIDFALKDNGEIVTFKETHEELKPIENKAYQAYRKKDMNLCN